MRLAREVERRLERLVDGATAAVFRGTMHPVDIADRLVRQADFVVEDGDSGPFIPNEWTVKIHASDLPPGVSTPTLETELARALADLAAQRAWKTNGPVSVEIEPDDAVPKGLTDCSGTTAPGDLEPWAQLVSASPPLVIEIGDNRAVLGRALECDAVIAVPELSRRQALIARADHETTIVDLSSVNGTFVNGDRISTDPHPLMPGDTVTMGDIDFIFRTV
ncbi:MAG: FhaA domain-containing protein [Actinomycetota bacterium]